MAEALKHMYDESFLDDYTDTIKQVIPGLNADYFRQQFRTPEWEARELKQRVAFLAKATDEVLPADFRAKINRIREIIRIARKKGAKDQNFIYIFLCDIVGENGLDNPEEAIPAIEMLTSFTSFEFAGRPFFIKYPEKMMEQMKIWAQHPDPNVRRYASEGCRPRLPWGIKLKIFTHDPAPIIPVLEILRDDPSEYVRKSVANNLNDISKDHPELVINIIRSWQKNASPNTLKIIKQAARTLLKKGEPTVLALFGHHDHVPFDVTNLTIRPTELPIGEEVIFEANLTNTDKEKSSFRVEYFVYFVKANGRHTKKIFKISDMLLSPGESRAIVKKHRFANLTTRKHYPGKHNISLVINGKETPSATFLLTNQIVPS